VDFASHINLAPQLLHHGGVIGTYASMSEHRPVVDFYPLMMNNITIRMVEIYAQTPERFVEICASVNAALSDRALMPRIDSTFALDDMIAAHERVESGQQMGNVIIEI